MNKIVIAGGSGCLGQVITNYFRTKIDEIVILGRSPKPSTGNIRNVAWNGRDLGEWKTELNGCDVLINLTGKSVNCRYTEKNKKEILDSRLNSNRVLGEATRQVENPPKLWIQAASSTIYRSSFDKPMDEITGEIGDDFSMNVCKQWEKSFWEQDCAHKKNCHADCDCVGPQRGSGSSPNQLGKIWIGRQARQRQANGELDTRT
jgi:uncharacterized protein